MPNESQLFLPSFLATRKLVSLPHRPQCKAGLVCIEGRSKRFCRKLMTGFLGWMESEACFGFAAVATTPSQKRERERRNRPTASGLDKVSLAPFQVFARPSWRQVGASLCTLGARLWDGRVYTPFSFFPQAAGLVFQAKKNPRSGRQLFLTGAKGRHHEDGLSAKCHFCFHRQQRRHRRLGPTSKTFFSVSKNGGQPR